MEVFDNKYLHIEAEKKGHLMEVDWKNDSANMTKQDHLESLEALYDSAKKYKPSKVFFNLSKFYYALDESDQLKIADLSKDFMGKGLEKCALIPSKGLMEQLSIEQTIEQVGSSSDVIRFFRDELTAKSWLEE